MLFRRFLTSVAVAAAVVLAGGSAARADAIDAIMSKDGEDLIKRSLDRLGQPKSVAVLKFQTQIGTAKPSFNSGVENMKMVERLQNLLIMNNRDANPYTVLADAGTAAAAKAHATKTAFDWTTEAGRKTLLTLQLPVAWNPSKKEAPEAYITGIVKVNADMKGGTVDLYGFTKADPATLVKLSDIKHKDGGKVVPIPFGRQTKADLGQSFAVAKSSLTLKGTTKGATRKFIDDSAADSAEAGNDKKDNAPVPQGGQPVLLEVLYDGLPQSPTNDPASGGEEALPTPAAGQKVSFGLTNTLDVPVGVLLCVNGINTVALNGESLARNDKPQHEYRLWVLAPGKRYDITGFLKDADGTSAPFKVLTEEESAAKFDTLAPTYAGKVQLFVYGKLPPKPNVTAGGTASTDVTTDNAGVDDALSSEGLGGSFEKAVKAAGSAAVAKRTTLTNVKSYVKKKPRGHKGIIEEHEQKNNVGKVETVTLEYDPEPVASRVIRYYSKDAGLTSSAKP